MKWHLSFFVVVVFLDACCCGRHVFLDDPKAETIDSLTFRTAQCSQCGMTVFGSVMTKVCGNVGCCLTPWDQGSFKEGGTDIMSGPKIGECNGFAFNQGNSPDGVGRCISTESKLYLNQACFFRHFEKNSRKNLNV